MTRTVVILGSGMAGLPVAHYLLGKTSAKVPDLRVVLVSPHDSYYWKIAAARAVIPGQLAEEKYMYPFAKDFAKYPSDKYELVLGKTEALDPDANKVTVRLNGSGASREIEYHTIVVATGARYRDDMPWKELATTGETRAAIAELQRKIRDAGSIVVGGAGVTGVELAGELASEYGRTKSITVVSSGGLPLEPRMLDRVRAFARDELVKMGVGFVGGARVESVTKLGDTTAGGGKTRVGLSSGEALTADLYLPTTGFVANSEFAPAHMLVGAGDGRMRQDRRLRSPGYDNVWVLGDVGDLQPAQAWTAEAQARHFMKQAEAYFNNSSNGESRDGTTPKTGEKKGRQQQKQQLLGDEEYAFDPTAVMLGMSIGRSRGTGQMGGWKVWSLIVWWFKCRHLGTDKAGSIAAGLTGATGGWP